LNNNVDANGANNIPLTIIIIDNIIQMKKKMKIMNYSSWGKEFFEYFMKLKAKIDHEK